MTKKFNLKADIRDKSEKVNSIRKAGLVPGVIYGGDDPNQNLKINKNRFGKIYEEAGESSLVDLEVGSAKPIKAIIKEVQYDGVKGEIQSVDFFRVNMKVPIEIEIPLDFIGAGKAIKDLGAMILTNLESINAKCLPGDLVDGIEVDLDSLKTLEDSIYVRDLAIPKGIELLTDPATVVVNVSRPRQEKEEVPAAPAEEAKAEETGKKKQEAPAQEKSGK